MITRTLLTASLLLASAAVSLRPSPEAPALELDHFYIVVDPGGATAASALRQAGLVVDTAVTRHEGEGTASVGAFFDNAYLELLWVDSSVAVDTAHEPDLADFRRAAAWRTSGASPFGVGLHFVPGADTALSVPTRIDPAPHLGPGKHYLLLRQRAESLATDLFIMPGELAVTAWMSRRRARRPDLFAHPLGARRVSRIVLYGPPTQRPQAAGLALQFVGFEPAPEAYLLLEFDGGAQGRRWDLRPTLPLVLAR